jgi:hypothetical protein
MIGKNRPAVTALREIAARKVYFSRPVQKPSRSSSSSKADRRGRERCAHAIRDEGNLIR